MGLGRPDPRGAVGETDLLRHQGRLHGVAAPDGEAEIHRPAVTLTQQAATAVARTVGSERRDRLDQRRAAHRRPSMKTGVRPCTFTEDHLRDISPPGSPTLREQ